MKISVTLLQIRYELPDTLTLTSDNFKKQLKTYFYGLAFNSFKPLICFLLYIMDF